MASLYEEIRRLTDERNGEWVKEGKPLADIAQEREFTPEERQQFEKLEREYNERDERISALRMQLEAEHRAMDWAGDLMKGGKRDTVEASEWRNIATGEVAGVTTGESITRHPVFERAAADSSAFDAAQATYGDIGGMARALATGGTGSAIVPTVWAGELIDLARSASATAQAGATIVPMEAKTVNIGRQTGDPTAGFRTESSAITPSDPTFDNVTLEAKTLSCIVIGSLEWWQDAENSREVVRRAIAERMAAEIDMAALYGGITTGRGSINLPTPPNPRGILAALNALRPANVLGSGAANGTTPTVAAGMFNEVIDTIFTVKDANEAPTAIVWSSKLARTYARAVDTTGQPLQLPAEVEALKRLQVNRIPSFTQGTMTTATDLFVGDFRQLLIGQRLQITMQGLGELYAGTGQYGVVAHWRGDIALARPGAFAVHAALKGA